MKTDFSAEKEPALPIISVRVKRVLAVLSWTFTIGLVIFTILLGWRQFSIQPCSEWITTSYSNKKNQDQSSKIEQKVNPKSANDLTGIMPDFRMATGIDAITRYSMLQTIIPSRPRYDIRQYSVQKGDTVFEIANKFKISPESVLWGNYDQLNDNPHLISEGMELLMPPVNGVLYRWQDGDTIDSVDAQFNTKS